MKVLISGACVGSKRHNELTELINPELITTMSVNEKQGIEATHSFEKQLQETCDYVLYIITPGVSGMFDCVRAVDSSNKRPSSTLLCILWEDTPTHVEYSEMCILTNIVKSNGGVVFSNLHEVAFYLTDKAVKIAKKRRSMVLRLSFQNLWNMLRST